jgi:hypothetical protein
LNTSEFAELDDFKLIVKKSNTNRIIFRLDIESNSGFKDFAKFDFIPTANFSTFETDKIAFSMTDEGNFGFIEIGNSKEGAGFTIKGIGNQLYGDSGLLISENNTKLVSYIYANYSTVKPFTAPNTNINIINDNYTGTEDQIGLEITQEVSFPHENVAQLDIIAKNKSGKNLKDLSLGYFYDWDIEEDADSNVAVLFDEINNSQFADKFPALGAELIYKPKTNIFVSCVAFSDESGSQPQIAGLEYDYTADFDKTKQLEVLNSGMTMQSNKVYDRSVFTGVKLFGNIAPNEERKISLLVGGNTSRDKLANDILAALSVNSVKGSLNYDEEIQVISYYNLNQIRININNNVETDFKINFFDLSGNAISCELKEYSVNNMTSYLYELPKIANQILLIRINSSLHNITQKVLWVD